MDDDKILEITGSIEEILGKDAFATISDKVGELLTGNAENMKQIQERDSEIQKLKDRNEKLVSANGALLQKVPVAKIEHIKPQEETKEKKISYKEIFDSKGNFLK